MFGILTETIIAIYVLFTKVANQLPTLIRSRKSRLETDDCSFYAQYQTQLTEQPELVRQLLSCLGIKSRSKVPVKVRSNRAYFRRR